MAAFEGIPTPICRNWEAYAYYREPSTNQAASRQAYARESTAFLQRSRAGLMLPTRLTNELIHEQLCARASLDDEAITMQGNCLYIPPLPEVSSHRARRQLMVHVGGPLMSELRLSWLCQGTRDMQEAEDEEEEDDEGRRRQIRQGGGGWWVSGCRSARCDTGRIRQVEGLPGFDELSLAEGGVGESWGMARAGYQALVFAVNHLPQQQQQQEDGQQADDDADDNGPVPFAVRFRQKLAFSSRLTSVAGWSRERAALLTESLGLWEWRAATGAAACDVDLSGFKQAVAEAQRDGARFNPQVVWGWHPSCLWVSAGPQLLHVDLRAKTPAHHRVLAGAHGVPVGEGPPLTAICDGEEWQASRDAVGALCRHPCREHVMWASTRACLVALDGRSLRGPLEVLVQSETSALLQARPMHNHEEEEAALLSAGQSSARLHLHLPEQQDRAGPGAEQKRVLSTWQSDTLWLAEGAGAGQQQPRVFPAYRSLTCFHPDLSTTRPQPVWLAGISLADAAGGGLAVASMTSLGDVYLQRMAGGHDEEAEQRPAASALLLPCGLSAHVAGSPSALTSSPLRLPSQSKPQPREPSALRKHRPVPVPADLQQLLRTARQPPHTTDASRRPSSSSLTALPASLAKPLLAFLSEEPRTLAQLHQHLTNSRRQQQQAMAMGELQAWLEQQDGVQAAVNKLLPTSLYHVRRQSEVHVRAAREEEEGPGVEESKRSQDRPEAACRCRPAAAAAAAARGGAGGQKKKQQQQPRPCGSPVCLVPHAVVYWLRGQQDDEEGGGGLRVRRTGGGKGRGGRGGVSLVSGMDRDTIEWLRHRWPGEDDEEEGP